MVCDRTKVGVGSTAEGVFEFLKMQEKSENPESSFLNLDLGNCLLDLRKQSLQEDVSIYYKKAFDFISSQESKQGIANYVSIDLRDGENKIFLFF